MLKLLSKLMPRERRFFDLFDQHAAFVYEGSVVLSELLHGYTDVEKRSERTARILELEHSADRVTREAAMAKLYATEAAQRVIDTAVQLFGGRGVVSGAPVESLYREIRALRIYEGTSEIQKLIIAREMLKE